MPYHAHQPFTRSRAALLALLLSSAFAAQSVHAHEYSAQLRANKIAEVERAVSAKLAHDANNADALLAKVDLILLEGKPARLDEASKIAELCIAHNAQNSECHEALGNVLGTKASSGGAMGALGSLGKIRDSFKTALELDPNNFSAASSLLTFYLEVPGLMGGSNSKARDLILEIQKNSPEVAKLLQAKYDLKDGKLDKARADALAVNVSPTSVAAKVQLNVLLGIGAGLMKEKKFAEAEKLLRETSQRFQDSANAYLGLGRALQEQGKLKEALPPLEKSLNMRVTASTLYRIGKTWQGLGDKAKAISAFEKALVSTPALNKSAHDDAQAQLLALK